jgi:formylglycine-generating enzyme required for sulfatase activity
MTGNVWEWVNSLYRLYPYNARDGREDQSTPGERVIRGGSWDDTGHSLPVAYRFGLSPDFYSRGIGFRCARSP